MTEGTADPAEPDVLDLYDVGPDDALICRVCGALVAQVGDYPQAHWDWHEASNGA